MTAAPTTPLSEHSLPGDRRSIIGGSSRRIDSHGKLTGETRYAEDITLPGMVHIYVLRSPHPHARLLELDTSQAERMPGVVRVITAEDVPGENGLTGYSQDEPVLTPVGDTLRQVGAPLALVVGDTWEQARLAAQAVRVEYQLLPHVYTVDEALQEGGVRIYPNGNILNTFQAAHGDLQAAFERCEVVLEAEYDTSFQEHSALEREAVLGYLDEEGRVTVVGATHEPHWQQGYIAQALGVDASQVRVIVPPTGGSFGGKQDPWPLVATGLVTHLLRRPARLAYSRREVFDATPKRHPYHAHLKVGATAQGELVALQARILANTGAYDSAGYYIPNYAVTGVSGPYAWQAVDLQAQVVYTNAPKCGQFRGFGAPQGVFPIECALDELSLALNIDPLELRLHNRLQQGAISALGYPVAESLACREVLEALRPRYQHFQAEAEAFNAAHPDGELRMGVGMAGMWYRFGKSGSLRIPSFAELAQDGHFIVYCSAPDYGQGIKTVMVQLAGEVLGERPERIELVNADTALTPDSNVQGASRATYFVGSSVVNAAENLKSEILAMAGEMLDRDPAGLALKEGRVASRAEPAIGLALAEVAGEFDRLGKPRKIAGVFDLSPLFPEATRPEYIPLFVTGAQAAQVLVDMETGLVRVQRMAAVHDVGRLINPKDAHGQIVGAMMMGIGSALLEEYIPGKSTGFSDYILPLIDAAPEIEVIFIETPSYHGPFGAKGVGETAILPTAPAIINAISRAIGVRLRRIPATPPRVLELVRGNSGRYGLQKP